MSSLTEMLPQKSQQYLDRHHHRKLCVQKQATACSQGGEAKEQEWTPAVLCFIVGIRGANTAHPQAVTGYRMLGWAHVGLQWCQPEKRLSTWIGITARTFPIKAGNCMKPRW